MKLKQLFLGIYVALVLALGGSPTPVQASYPSMGDICSEADAAIEWARSSYLAAVHDGNMYYGYLQEIDSTNINWQTWTDAYNSSVATVYVMGNIMDIATADKINANCAM